MKNKILTAISTLMLFVPWTILPLRIHYQWTLDKLRGVEPGQVFPGGRAPMLRKTP